MIKKEQLIEGLKFTQQYIEDSLITNEVMKKTTGNQQVIEELEQTLNAILENIKILQGSEYIKYLLSKGYLSKE